MPSNPSPLLPPTPESPKKTRGQVVRAHLKSTLLAGFITLLPVFISLYFLTLIFDFVTKFTGPIAAALVRNGVPAIWPDVSSVTLSHLESFVSPLLALILSGIVVYVLGVLGTFVVGRRLLEALEQFVENLPLVKGIYGTTKQVIGVFKKGSGGSGFQRVVLVEFPRTGTWTVGFVTNTITDTSTNTRMVCTFIPMTPNPTSGFFQLFPEQSVRNTDWTVDQGIKIVLSGGLLAPDQLHLGEDPKPTPPPV